MLELFVNEEGGLTAGGYGLCIGILLVCLLAAAVHRGGGRAEANPRRLAFCAMAAALAYVTSFIRVFKLPYGGSVTLMSMLFIVLAAYWFGVRTGVLVGFAYGILQFLQEPYFLSLFQVCCDYVLAFAALGAAGFFRNRKNGLIKGYVLAVLLRGAFHALGGYLYWMDYMPDTFPQSLRSLYPIIYNYSFLLAEGAMTIILLKIPAVEKALDVIGRMATSKGSTPITEKV
ncbi:MAG: proton-coupled thiamine transporter YuaJ [Oscillibacter sp.]|nr:proton-coupled thiamine transporter YuaJ [Oscillibacter sp.]